MMYRTPAQSVGLALATAFLFLSSVLIHAYAEMPAADPTVLDGVEHGWVTEQMGFLPYTEPGGTEQTAVSVAGDALTSPPAGVTLAADHGYVTAQEAIRLAGSLAGTEGQIVGHELILWNGRTALRLSVGSSGLVTVIDSGAPGVELVVNSVPVSDPGDKDALEIGMAAFGLASHVDARVEPATGGLIVAHYVGFADADGSHLVVRVGVDGSVSYQ